MVHLIRTASFHTQSAACVVNITRFMFIVCYNNTGKPAEYRQVHNFIVMPPTLEKHRIIHEIHRERYPIVSLQLQCSDHGLIHPRNLWSIEL